MGQEGSSHVFYSVHPERPGEMEMEKWRFGDHHHSPLKVHSSLPPFLFDPASFSGAVVFFPAPCPFEGTDRSVPGKRAVTDGWPGGN